MQKFGQLHYKVKLDTGYVLKRHIDQLKKSEVSKKVQFAEPSPAPPTLPEPCDPVRQFYNQGHQRNPVHDPVVNMPQGQAPAAVDAPHNLRPQRQRNLPQRYNNFILY